MRGGRGAARAAPLPVVCVVRALAPKGTWAAPLGKSLHRRHSGLLSALPGEVRQVGEGLVDSISYALLEQSSGRLVARSGLVADAVGVGGHACFDHFEELPGGPGPAVGG